MVLLGLVALREKRACEVGKPRIDDAGGFACCVHVDAVDGLETLCGCEGFGDIHFSSMFAIVGRLSIVCL